MADGFEDIEALIPVDVLRRGGVDIKTVSVNGSNIVESAHGVQMVADLTFEEAEPMLKDADLLMLPGGLPGADNLNAHEGLKKALVAQAEAGKMVERHLCRTARAGWTGHPQGQAGHLLSRF